MSRVIIVTGRLAQTPYRIRKIERNIYSVEELCYSLMQSAQFLDASIMDPALADWLEKECGLPDLAAKLRLFLGKERTLPEFVSTILNYTAYVTQDKRIQTKKIVSSGSGMEPYERRLTRADYLAENGYSYQAVDEYQGLLDDLPEPERQMRSALLRRIGSVYAQLFRFRAAADSYQKAYELTKDDSDYLKYLAAVRLSLSPSEYVSFVSEHPESYNASLELEKKVRENAALFEESEAARQIEKMKEYKEKGQDTNYELTLHDTVQKLKDEYRNTKTPSL